MDTLKGLLWNLVILTAVVIGQLNVTPIIPTDLPTYFSVKEDTALDTVIFTLRASDQNLNDVLQFSTATTETSELVKLSTPTRTNVATNEWSCDVKLKSKLDRDNSPGTRNLYFGIKDNSSPIQFKILMLISDVNDNPPVFVDLPYRTSVREDTPIDTFIFKVTATDADSNRGASITYSMNASSTADEIAYRQTFALQQFFGNVTLIKPLNYEQRSFYHFKVSAQDQGDFPCPGPTCKCEGTDAVCNPEPVDLFITVIDVQDTPPVFDRLPYLAEVSENKAVGSSILQVTAADGDRGVDVPNKVIFSFTAGDHTPFTINQTDGTISVGQPLDADKEEVRNRGGLFLFTVLAEEVSPPGTTNFNSRTSTQVSITVTDENDNIPKFNEDVYTATVLENTPKGVPITITSNVEVVDDDQGINSTFQISLLKDGLPYLDFDTLPRKGQTIQGKTSITITVVNSSALDFESLTNITFKLVATEVGTSSTNSSEATVILQILDTNDNSPYFPDQITQFNISEDTSAGRIIGTVLATDVDSGDFGQVTYTLESDGHDGEFTINGDGEISLASPIDREKRSSYSLVVVATDSPSEPEPQRRRSRQRVDVKVTDVNDHDPEWIQYISSVNVMENEDLGTVVTDLQARDLDEGLNGDIEYSIATGTNGSSFFAIVKQNDRAELVINSSLIGYSGLRVVRAIATDKGTPPRSASVELSVNVVDVNLNVPVFTYPDQNAFNATTGTLPEVVVDEELPIGSRVAQLVAEDADLGINGEVGYYLVPTINRDFEYFRLNRVDGTLTADRRLDMEQQEVYEIQVKAEDNGEPAPLSTTLTMRVRLKDIDDNFPSYKGVNMPQVLSVEEENDTAIVGQLQPAIDEDSDPENRKLCYYFHGGDSISSFQLDKQTGQLSLKEKIDRETTEYLNLVIKASPDCTLDAIIQQSDDTSDTPSSLLVPPPSYNASDDSLLWVRVEVIDINDHPPKFVDPSLSVGVIFDVEIGTEVMSLTGSVMDSDTPVNSKHSFRMVSQKPVMEGNVELDTSKPAFVLSPNGTIDTNIRFRSDLLGYFLLEVMVYDAEGQEDSAEIRVYLISNLQRIKLVFNKLPNEVEQLKHDFVKQLSDILNLDIVIDRIMTHTLPDGTRDPTKTDAFIHGRYKDTGEIVPAPELWRSLDFNQAARSVLLLNGVMETQALTEDKDDDSEADELKRIFAIVLAVLAITIVALILVLIHMVRLYRRRLRAATTMAYASPKEQEMYEHPGTNKYYAAENPLFGKEIKQAALEDEEERTSRNSLDLNAVHTSNAASTAPRLDHDEEQEMVLHITESTQSTPGRSKDINHNPNLDQVLQAYRNSAFEDDADDIDNDNDTIAKPTRNGHVQRELSPHGHFIPGVGDDVQEGVTRFSDEILSRDSGFPDPSSRSHLEYTDI